MLAELTGTQVFLVGKKILQMLCLPETVSLHTSVTAHDSELQLGTMHAAKPRLL